MPRHRRPRAHGEPSCHAGTYAVGRGRVGGLRHVRHGRGIARDRQWCRGRVDEAGPRFARGARRGRPSRAGGRSVAQPAPPGGRSPRAPDVAVHQAGRACGRGGAAAGRGAAPGVSKFRTEIAEQPGVVARLLTHGAAAASSIGERMRAAAPGGIVIAARGSSDNAALYAKYLFGVRNQKLVALAAPSLFTHYARPPRLDGQCVLGISQSGESPDVVAVIEEARRQGSLTIAITNVAESRLARAAELVLPLEAGEEVSVPASKTYTASLVALALISQALDPDALFESALQRVPQAIARALESENDIEALVPPLLGPRAIVLGRGFNFSTAEEVALKLSETSYVLARAWSVADFEHGPIAIAEAGLPVLTVDGGGLVAADLESVRARLEAKGAQVLHLFEVSGLPEELTPIPLAVLGQLLAHNVAVARGVDPDQPRTIQKVTRTW